MITFSLMKQIRVSLITACGMLLASASLQAATIVNYTFAGGTGDPSNVATDTISATTAVAAYTSSGVIGFSSASTGSWYSRLKSNGSNPWKLPTTLDAAVTAGTYLDFTITPNAEKTVDLSTVEVDVYAQVLTGATSFVYTGHFNLSVTIDGVTTDLGTQSYSVNRSSTGVTTISTLSYDLSGLDNLDSTASFRLTMYLDSGSTYDYYDTLRVEEIRINAVPEPTSVALSLIGGSFILLFGFQKYLLPRRRVSPSLIS